MTLRKKLGTGIERLELRAAPSTLLGTGISLDPLWHDASRESKFEVRTFGTKEAGSSLITKPHEGWGSQSDSGATCGLMARPQAIQDALFSAKAAARKGLSDGAGQHAYARSADMDEAHVASFPTGATVIEGASSLLRRTPNGVSWTLKTNNLQAGHVYTLWVVVFNNPEACEGGCGLDDLFRPDVQTTLAYGGGHIVGPSGEATFSGHLQEGDTSGFPLDSPFVGIPGQHIGLADASQAEIHLVVRDHGEKIPGRVAEQIGTFSGGCDVNACANVQFAAHQP